MGTNSATAKSALATATIKAKQTTTARLRPNRLGSVMASDATTNAVAASTFSP